MTILMTRVGMVGVVAVLFSGCGSPAPQESAPLSPPPVVQPAPTTKPEVSINAVMVGLVDHAAHNLWDVERPGRAPKTDAAWMTVQEHAVQIAAAGPAIGVGGTGPTDTAWVKTPSWHVHAQRMSDAGVAALNAAKDKNLEALVAANGQLVETCEACHKEFKPDLPTEGIVHSHAH
jgi:cytochrome c556